MDVRNTTSSGSSHTVRRTIVAIAATLGMIAGSVTVAPAANAAPVATAAAASKVKAATPAATLTKSGYTMGTPRDFDLQLIAYVNAARAKVGAPQLQEAQGLTDMSVLWSRVQLGTLKKLAHNPNAFQQVTQYGAKNRLAWGENVGVVPSVKYTAKDLFDTYMASPGHRANILNPKYHFVGMGSFAKGQMLYNTMTFTDRVESLTATKRAPSK